ncbi:hypothetical protein PVK06_027742 [Gossypium arboreum]|uniref:Protein kinase domain-containing protein n=1 Tax=Gossypium arboreum TaxID=29729 RepID=A0ABR0P1D1_GOSAR|nr:hypothetical protein PVK06_027742 [Gossypium arboreum]
MPMNENHALHTNWQCLALSFYSILESKLYLATSNKFQLILCLRHKLALLRYNPLCSATNSETKEDVAIKKTVNAFDHRIDAKRTLREIKLLCHMDHDNIIKIKDIIPLLEKGKFNDVYIAYELMDISLHQIIWSSEALTDDHC